MKQAKHCILTLAGLLCGIAASAEEIPIDIASRANEMLYTNAPCTNTVYGDQFVSWDVLFDGNAYTFFHSEYNNKQSADGLDHYLRVDMGAGNSVSAFTFTYTVRGNDASYTPSTIVVEGSNSANGNYTEIATLTDLPTARAAVYKSSKLDNGNSYRYIRFRVTSTVLNAKVYNHPYFYFAEFGMSRVVDKTEDELMGIITLSELSNGVLYHISQPHHSSGMTSWAVQTDGMALKSNVDLGITIDKTDIRQQFAFVSNDGGSTRYLYHVSESKFVNKDGSLGTKPLDAINLKDGAYRNTFVAYFDDSHYVNVGGSRQMTIDGWTTPDGGNSCVILPVGEFDVTEALKAFAPEIIEVTGITLSDSLVSLVEGESLLLSATVSPDNATDQRVVWSISNPLVATVDSSGKVTAVSSGTATITASCGGKSSSCVVTVEKKEQPQLTSGEYYLYNAATKQFLSRGEYWGTCATVDKYGIPFVWTAEEYSLRFLDNNLCLFETDDSNVYTDNNSTGFAFEKSAGGYLLKSQKSNRYLTIVDGAYTHQIVNVTDNDAAATLWQPLTKAEHDAIVAGYVEENYANVIAASGITATAGDFADYLANLTAVDKTALIGTARFTDGAGDWVYNEVRHQDWQPAYGADFCELWQATGHYTQTITGLVEGIYKVTVQGFERAGGWAECNALGERGYEITTATLSANGEEVNLKSWYSGKSGDNEPDNTGQAVAKFAEGKYMNEIYTYVGADGTLTIMVNKPGFVGSNWVLFNNFTLSYCFIAVSDITLNQTTATLTEGDTLTLTATVTPSNADNTSVNWSSSNRSVATVDANGKVTAVAPGTVTITATANDGSGVSASCELTVEKKIILVSHITLDQLSATFIEGETLALTATVTPSNADDTSVTWRSSNTNVATVDANGKVTAVAPGTVTIIVTANDGSGVSASCELTVEKKIILVSHITLDHSSATLIEGETLMLTATVAPSNADDTSVSWRSSNIGVATVDSKGVVTAISSGKATITASTNDGSQLSADCQVTVLSTSGTCGENLIWRLTDANELIIEGEGSMTNYANEADVPWHVYKGSIHSVTIGKGVTSIGNSAFSDCRNLTSITLPESVTSIGNSSFCNCERLAFISIPKGVTNIEALTFWGCSSLSSIILPEDMTSIENRTFSYCSSLTTIIIPSNVTSIGNYAFSHCSSLTSVTLPEGVTDIGDCAFRDCSNLTSFTLPKHVINIGEGAFRNCTQLFDFYSYSEEAPLSASDAFSGTNLSKATLYVPTCALSDYKRTAPWSGFGEIKGMTIEGVEIDGICYNLITNKQTADVTSCDVKYAGDIIIPSVVTYDGVTYPVTGIGDYAFSACTGLFSVILPECLTSIGADAFSACYLMASIRIPENVVSIGSRAFYYCISLTSVVVPESVQVIDDSAFEGCGSLSSVSLPNGLSRIGSRAFANCDNLLAVYCSSESVPVTDADAFANSNLAHATLYVPSVSISVYRSTAPWSSFGNIEDIDNAEMGIGLLQPNSIDATIYDLTGRKLQVDSFNELPKGIYIIDGRKVMVK